MRCRHGHHHQIKQKVLWLILAFVLRRLKEFGEPTRKALIMDLSPDHCKSGTFGRYYLIRDVFVSLAAFGVAFLWQISPETNLVTAFISGIIGNVGFAVFGRVGRWSKADSVQYFDDYKIDKTH